MFDYEVPGDEGEVLELLTRHGAILSGHFVLTSGRHAASYVNKDAIYPHVDAVAALCDAMVIALGDPAGIDSIVGPEKGGIILSQWAARSIDGYHGRALHAVYAEKAADGRFEFRRGYGRFVARKRALIVEDVVTTGGSVAAVVEAVRSCGGTVAGVACIVNRGGVTAEQLGLAPGVPFVALAKLDLPSWDASVCPLCRDGVPVRTDAGKGREFLAGRGTRA